MALEFLGPLVLAALTSTSRRALSYPALAMIGVVLLTRPWIGNVDVVGILFALGSGLGWALYIVLTQRVGDRFSGISALAYTIPIVAIAYAPIGLPEALPYLSLPVIATAPGLALLMPVIPLAFEIVALRAMAPAAFGTLMCWSPRSACLSARSSSPKYRCQSRSLASCSSSPPESARSASPPAMCRPRPSRGRRATKPRSAGPAPSRRSPYPR